MCPLPLVFVCVCLLLHHCGGLSWRSSCQRVHLKCRLSTKISDERHLAAADPGGPPNVMTHQKIKNDGKTHKTHKKAINLKRHAEREKNTKGENIAKQN